MLIDCKFSSQAEVIFENEAYAVLYKPRGMPTAPLSEDEEGTLVSWFLKRCPEAVSVKGKKDINHNFRLGNFPHIRETIGLDVWEELVNSPIGVVARLAGRESVWSGRTVHYLLCRQLRVIKKEIWCLVADEAIRFSLLEFGEITGLNTGPLPTERFEPDQYKEFWEELKVPLGMGPKLDELKAALAFCPLWSFEKRKWLGLLLLQAMGVYCLHHNSRIPFQSAIRVFDDEAMGSYPWGRTAYEVLIDSIKTLAPEGGSYTISSMTVALLFGRMNPSPASVRILGGW